MCGVFIGRALHFSSATRRTFIPPFTVATHQGGYGEFTCDITPALKPTGPQEVTLAVWDPTDAGNQPRGKQVNRPNSIWYTSVTGIWQTVWMEPVADASIDALTLVPDIDKSSLAIQAAVRGTTNGETLEAVALDGATEVGRVTGKPGDTLQLTIKNPKLWSPDTPFLYDLKLNLRRDGKTLDEVSSYFGLRKTSLVKNDKGLLRLGLNNKPLFQVGPLDQGWWPDGLYTAPTDEALKSDIEITKKLGFNMARKHVKVEPDRWYYWCDKLGLLVWQDMPSTSGTRTADSNKQFEAELRDMIDQRRNHPSIVMWVPFNEGWGQYETERIVQWIKTYDPSRLVDNASGWTDRNVGDVHDVHTYPGPQNPRTEPTRAFVIGEFGGLGLPIAGHTWQDQANWSYRGFKSPDELTDAYVDLLAKVHPLIGLGLSAAVYTQTTDVEVEINGLLTYDRAQVKGNIDRIRAANLKLFTPPPPMPILKTIAPTAQDQPITWRFTTTAPVDSWSASDFDDAAWETGPGGFGTANTPNTTVRTTWNTPDIWVRRTFDLPQNFAFEKPTFIFYHDEDAEVYLNGQQVLKVTGFNGNYEQFPLTPEAIKLLKAGKNTVAIHCHQTVGGQYVDLGLADLVTPKQ